MVCDKADVRHKERAGMKGQFAVNAGIGFCMLVVIIVGMVIFCRCRAPKKDISLLQDAYITAACIGWEAAQDGASKEKLIETIKKNHPLFQEDK